MTRLYHLSIGSSRLHLQNAYRYAILLKQIASPDHVRLQTILLICTGTLVRQVRPGDPRYHQTVRNTSGTKIDTMNQHYDARSVSMNPRASNRMAWGLRKTPQDPKFLGELSLKPGSTRMWDHKRTLVGPPLNEGLPTVSFASIRPQA